MGADMILDNVQDAILDDILQGYNPIRLDRFWIEVSVINQKESSYNEGYF